MDFLKAHFVLLLAISGIDGLRQYVPIMTYRWNFPCWTREAVPISQIPNPGGSPYNLRESN